MNAEDDYKFTLSGINKDKSVKENNNNNNKKILYSIDSDIERTPALSNTF